MANLTVIFYTMEVRVNWHSAYFSDRCYIADIVMYTVLLVFDHFYISILDATKHISTSGIREVAEHATVSIKQISYLSKTTFGPQANI